MLRMLITLIVFVTVMIAAAAWRDDLHDHAAELTAALRGPMVEQARPGQPYDPELYGEGWADDDGDCLDARSEVLARLSSGPPTFDESGCVVIGGRWFDHYSGRVLTGQDVVVERLVPLAWAHARGADAWPPARKRDFASWEPNLAPMSRELSLQRAAHDPLSWTPPRVEQRCEYVLRIKRISGTWGLRLSEKDALRIRTAQNDWCSGH